MTRQISPAAALHPDEFVVILRDNTGRANGLDKVGTGLHTRFAFWDELDDATGGQFPKTKCPVGFAEADNWRRDDLRSQSSPIDVRYAVQLIADRDHEFGGSGGGLTDAGDGASGLSGATRERGPAGGAGTITGGGGAGAGESAKGCDTSPAHWSAFNRSTRLVDQFPDVRGGTDATRGEALLVSTVCVVDDPAGPFAGATVVGPVLEAGGRVDGSPDFLEADVTSAFAGGVGAGTSTVVANQAGSTIAGGGAGTGSRLASGHNFDGDKVGVWWSIVRNRGKDDVIGSGVRSTDCSLSGIRHDAHFEWDEHGRLYITPEDISNLADMDGMKFKSYLAWDKTVANAFSALGHETAQIRPVVVISQFAPPTCLVEDAVGTPTTNPGGDRAESGGASDDDMSTAQLDGGGKTGKPPKDGGGGGRPIGYEIFFDPSSGMRVGLDNDLSNSSSYGTALRLGAEHSAEPPAGNADVALTGGLIGDLVVDNRRGPSGDLDRSIVYVFQGDGSTTPTAGEITLAETTQIGAQISDDPVIRWGHTEDTRRIEQEFDSSLGSGRFRIAYFDDNDAYIDEQIDVVAAFDLQDTSEASIYSWAPESNFRLEKAGAEIGGEPTGGMTFAGKAWMGSDNGLAEFAYRTIDNVVMRAKLDSDPELIYRHGVVMDEQSSDPGSTGAGEGTWWVKDDTPSRPYFTDDTGVDFDLTEGSGGGSGASTSEDVTVSAPFEDLQVNLDYLNAKAARCWMTSSILAL